MALIQCKECGNKVSQQAKACPNCGAAVAKPVGVIGFLVLIIFAGWVLNLVINSLDEPVRVVAPLTPEELRQRAIDAQFLIDGSHFQLTQLIRSRLNDPDSYSHVSTTYTESDDGLIVEATYRAANGYGATVLTQTTARVSLAGEVLEIIPQ